MSRRGSNSERWWALSHAWRQLLLALLWTLIAAPVGTASSLVLRTGSGLTLQSESLLLSLPFGVAQDRIEFAFGFASSESATESSLLDSLSISLRPQGQRQHAILLTADAPGVVWQPINPGGLTLLPASVRATETPFPASILGAANRGQAYTLSLAITDDLRDCSYEMTLDLFDNRDAQTSVGFLSSARLIAAEPYFVLESSASPLGPFAAEDGVRHAEARQVFALRRGGQSRFFRLLSDSDVRFRMLAPTESEWRFAYEFPAPKPVLESATRAEGPYSVVAEAELDLMHRVFTVGRVGRARFFRISGNVRAQLRSPYRDGERLALPFDFVPRVFRLQSSAQACGPFADEQNAHVDVRNQRAALPRNHPIRFFRISHSNRAGSTTLRPVQDAGELWEIPYELTR